MKNPTRLLNRTVLPIGTALVTLALASIGHAQQTWTGATNNNWNTSTNWTSAVPTANATVGTGGTPAGSPVISAPAPGMGTLTLNNTGGNVQINSSLTVTRMTSSAGTGFFTVGSGGVLTVNGDYLGAGFNGVVDGGSIGGTLNPNGFVIGRAGTSTLTFQNSGSATLSDLVVGRSNGTGTLNINSGSTVNATQFRMALDGTTSSSATLNLNGGSLTTGAVSQVIGSDAGGSLQINIAGGTWNQAGGAIYLGQGGMATQTTVSAGGFNLTGATALVVGRVGTGHTFTQSGTGTVTSASLRISEQAASAAAYTQSGGTLTTGSIDIGGVVTGASGTYTLSGTGLVNATNLVVGGSVAGTTGTLNLNGGTANVTNGSTNATLSHSVVGSTTTLNGTALTVDRLNIAVGTFANGTAGSGGFRSGTLVVNDYVSFTTGTAFNVGDGVGTGDATLRLSNGSLANNFSQGLNIRTDGRLEGLGTVLGNVSNAGVLAIGNSPGAMTFNNNLTLTSTSTNIFEINGLAITDFDRGLGGSGTSALTLGGTLQLDFTGSYNDGDSFDILSGWNSIGGSFSSVNFTGLGAGLSAEFATLGGIGTVTVVPEPSSIALLVVSGLGLLALRRKRNR